LFGKQQIIAIGGGAIGGVLLVALLVALLIRLDTTIHSPEEVHAMVGLQVLGSTPLSSRA
jgi:capsular polysaccharide biosynthesis protein